MAKLSFNISLYFPVVEVENVIRYKETKKPDGLSYLLLVLISNGQRKKLTNLLIDFGIPENLHGMCKTALYELMRNNMIVYKDGNTQAFEDVLVSNLKFTEEGEKVFKEEIIVTGKELTCRDTGYYYPLLNEYKRSVINNSEITNFLTYYRDLFFESEEDFDKKLIEEYYDAHKNILGIEENEVISNVFSNTHRFLFKFHTAKLNIEDGKASIEIDNPILENFANSKYPTELFRLSFNNLSLYKFDYTSNLQEINFNKFKGEIVNGLTPNDFNKILHSSHFKMVITDYDLNSVTRDCSFRKQDLGDAIDCYIDYLVIDKSNNIICYYNKRFNFDGTNIQAPLSIKTRLTPDEFKSVFDKIMKFDLDVKTINILNEATHFTDELKEKLINSYSNVDYYDIQTLKELSAAIKPSSTLFDSVNTTILNVFNRGLKEANDENKLSALLRSSKEYLDNIDHIQAIIDRGQKLGLSNYVIYTLLLEGACNKSTVLKFINPLVDLEEIKKSDDEDFVSYLSFFNKIKKLIEITDIQDPKNYVYEDIEENALFSNTFLSAKKDYSKCVVFKDLAGEGFKKNEYYFLNVFTPIYEEMLMYSAAMSGINNITEKNILKKIEKGRFTEVFANISAKLTYFLKNNLKLSGKLTPMLIEARKQKLINNDIATDLLAFVENRNKIIHLESNEKTNYTPEDLRRWSKQVFDLFKGDSKDESSSKN